MPVACHLDQLTIPVACKQSETPFPRRTLFRRAKTKGRGVEGRRDEFHLKHVLCHPGFPARNRTPLKGPCLEQRPCVLNERGQQPFRRSSWTRPDGMVREPGRRRARALGTVAVEAHRARCRRASEGAGMSWKLAGEESPSEPRCCPGYCFSAASRAQLGTAGM